LASQLLVAQKKQLVEHKADLMKDGQKMSFKDQLAYCQENFQQSPSSRALQNLGRQGETVNHLSDSNQVTARRSCAYSLNQLSLDMIMILIC